MFWLSSLHNPHAPRFPYADKAYHIILYSGFSFIFIRAAEPLRRHWKKWVIVIFAIGGAVLYGATDEFHQRFVAGRTADLADMAADAVGGLLGGLSYLIIRRGSRKVS